ncbi:MAG: cytochrome c [Burkholderiaceae bacterium]|jgi:cytochrome c556|nr:cytochrome c [Burkholderiaceae bacterium]
MIARRTALSLAAASFAAFNFASPACAQFAKPEDAVKYRQSAFAVMGTHMGRLGAMAQGKAPFDAEVARRSAQIVETMARLPWEGFIPATESLDSHAKPELYRSADDIKRLVEALNVETAKLPAAAGSLETLRTQVGATGKACKACHDKYRTKI